MTDNTAIRHPSPHRAWVALGGVSFGLLAGPSAWALAHVATYSIASVACYPGHAPRPTASGLGWVGPLALALDVIALAVSVAAGVVAHRAWTASRAEAEGDAGHAAEIGEGRTRFMALWGMLISGTFFVLIAFDTISLLMVPLCSH